MWHKIFASSWWGGPPSHSIPSSPSPQPVPNHSIGSQSPHNMALVFGKVVCFGCMACCVIAAICSLVAEGRKMFKENRKNREVWLSGGRHVVGTAFKLLLIGEPNRNETNRTKPRVWHVFGLSAWPGGVGSGPGKSKTSQRKNKQFNIENQVMEIYLYICIFVSKKFRQELVTV